MNMKRELKFRAWDNRSKEWLLGYELPNLGGFSLTGECMLFGEYNRVLESFSLSELDELIIEQYTGLKDKNGVETYEGDIIEFDREEWRGDDNIHVVTWDNEEGGWNWGGGTSSDMEHRIIIGNIHQHPHLLTQK